MEWYEQGIGPAIQEAKSRNTLFVVVIVSGPDSEGSGPLLDTLDQVSQKLAGTVAVKLIHGSDSFQQFTQLYPVILVPSIYFIDSKTGVDLEVTGGPTVTAESLTKSIEKAFAAKSGNGSSPPSEPQKENATRSESSDKSSLDERVARAKKLLQEKREQKEQEENEKSKNNELERRALGKNIQEMKRKHEEEEAVKLAEQRKRDKEEERQAKERVRAQIAQDRADKAARFNQLKNEEEQKRQENQRQKIEQEAAARERQAAERSTMAKVQFRLPDGRTRTNNFDAGAPLSSVYQYVSDEVAKEYGRSFSLSTAFPRRQLDAEPRTSTLRDLGLAPSATVMVLPSSDVTDYSGSFVDYIWLLLTPFTLIWTFIQSFFATTESTNAGGPSNERKGESQPSNTQSASKKRTYTKDGNIARLRRGEDDDDETNTYNGNSTQQM